MTTEIGKPIPQFEAEATNGTIRLNDLQGKTLVLYFYPKDNTPGCTTEGENFRDLYPEFQKLNCEIFGISRDSVKSHINFKTKKEFPFELISDPEENLCHLFDVIKQKNMYGKQVRGIERSTFIINKKGELSAEWRKVKVAGHAQEVLDFIKQLET